MGITHNSQVACQPIDLVQTEDYLMGDKDYDSEKIRDKARSQNIIPVVSRRPDNIRGAST